MAKHSSHNIINGGGSLWGGNPAGGPRNFTIMGTLQPPTVRYGRAPTPRLRLDSSNQKTASVTQQGRHGRVRNIQPLDKAK